MFLPIVYDFAPYSFCVVDKDGRAEMHGRIYAFTFPVCNLSDNAESKRKQLRFSKKLFGPSWITSLSRKRNS